MDPPLEEPPAILSSVQLTYFNKLSVQVTHANTTWGKCCTLTFEESSDMLDKHFQFNLQGGCFQLTNVGSL